VAPRVVVLAFVLAGLFAMHGLGDHGAAHQGSHDAAAVAVAAKVSMNHGTQADPSATTKAHGAGSPLGVPAEDSPAVAMAGVCLAVLAGAMVGLLLLRGLRAAVPSRLRSRLKFATEPFAALRDRDPPCLFDLSIQRC
jgi:hypothetical protein